MMHPRDEGYNVDRAAPEPNSSELRHSEPTSGEPTSGELNSGEFSASPIEPALVLPSSIAPAAELVPIPELMPAPEQVALNAPEPVAKLAHTVTTPVCDHLSPPLRNQVSDESQAGPAAVASSVAGRVVSASVVSGSGTVALERAARDLSSSNPALPAVVVGSREPAGQLAYSTLSSLLVVFVLILTIRFTVPPLVESLRYSWHHGQLRAEYEIAGQRLQNVSLNSLSEASELVSRRMGPSVVHINMLEVYATPRLLGRTERVSMVGQGSGVILDAEGHILTNQHVIDEDVVSENSGRIEVSLSDGRRLIAERIGVDAATDLAVIKVRADGLLPAEWGDSDRVDVGTPVWAVGSPFGLERTVTFGIISGKHRMNLRGTRWDLSDPKALDRSQSTIYRDLMQTDVAVNPGNSGGPLVNAQGEIVGINTAIIDEHYIGISFAIPSNVARRVAEHLIRDGEVARGWLGVKLTDPVAVVDDSTGNLSAAPGAMVYEVVPSADSPARVAGILAGDLIVKFGDYPIADYRSLVSRVAQTDVGSTVPVEVIRNGESIMLNVEISLRKRSY